MLTLSLIIGLIVVIGAICFGRNVLNFIAETHEQVEREFANAFGRPPSGPGARASHGAAARLRLTASPPDAITEGE